jgi:hypothetical protein
MRAVTNVFGTGLWLLLAALGIDNPAGLESGPAPDDSARPVITIEHQTARATIRFTGGLQSAQTPAGPWTDLPNAVSPFTVDANAGQQFFRTRALASDSVFSSRSVAELTVSGPLQQHFDLAFAGVPDGIFPPVREKPWFEATVAMDGATVPATLRVRGNSSLQECPFPKLKFKVSRENREGTPFFDAREVKIGTHCAEGGSGNVGRLRDERAAFREALAYETMELLGFISPRVRRARIDYRDTSPAQDGSDTGWQLARHAMLLDDIEVVAERMGGRALEDEEIGALENAGFDPQLITELELLHVLLGNWDYALSTDGRELWNTGVIELPGKELVPVAGDFDLASFVTGVVRPSAPHDYHPELPELERETRFKIAEIQKRVGVGLFQAAAARFREHRPGMEAQINAAELDDPGRANALAHLAAFFDALDAATK